MKEKGFEILTQERLLCDCRAPAQIFLAWLYDILRLGSRSLAARLILTAFLFAPISLLATALSIVAPTNLNTYADNIIFARKN